MRDENQDEAVGTTGATGPGMVRLTVAVSATGVRSPQDLLDAFRFVVMGTRLESGCLGCSAWADPDATVRYVEEWLTEADMRRRVRSDDFTSLLSIVESAGDPRVQFDFVTTRRGLDYVAEVRSDLLT
jgi:quinol monooxygenase YgiN